MQTCFFAISGVLPRELAIEKIKSAAEKSYSKKGREVVEANWKAIDETLANLHKVVSPPSHQHFEMPEPWGHAPDFVRVTAGTWLDGDPLPVRLRWHWPTGTAVDKQSGAVPVWDEDCASLWQVRSSARIPPSVPRCS
jgi:pyruvate-ferredoxin/flavodoxin oxidoreductase